jgi:hypothetical protein
MIQIYDCLRQKYISITPDLEGEFLATLQRWKEEGRNPETLEQHFAHFCDVATGRIAAMK